MKIFTLLTIIVIVMGTNHQSKFNYGRQRSLMAVMTEVEAKIQSHSPLDAVLEILTQFRSAVNTEQVNHDQIFFIEQNECQSEQEFRNAEIVNAKNVLRDSNNQLSICQYSKNRVTEQQQVNQQQENTFQQHLNSIQSQAENEQGYYKKRSRQYEDSLHAIDEALTILEGISFGYRNFAELSKVSQRLLQTSFEIKQTLQYAPIFRAFIELAKQGEQFDLSALQAVEHLLRDLQTYIQESFNEFTQSNAQSVALFNNQKEKVNKVLSRLQQQYERQTSKLDKLNTCISVQQAVSNTASAKEQRNQQLLDQAQSLCSTFETEFNYATKSRREEIQLVNQLEEMVKQRFAQVKDERVVIRSQRKPPVTYYARMKY